MQSLILKRASASRPSGEWNDDDFDVLADGAVVGRIFNAAASPVGTPWMWTLAFGHHEDRTPTTVMSRRARRRGRARPGHGGCSIYANQPPSCRAFVYGWLTAAEA